MDESLRYGNDIPVPDKSTLEKRLSELNLQIPKTQALRESAAAALKTAKDRGDTSVQLKPLQDAVAAHDLQYEELTAERAAFLVRLTRAGKKTPTNASLVPRKEFPHLEAEQDPSGIERIVILAPVHEAMTKYRFGSSNGSSTDDDTNSFLSRLVERLAKDQK